MSVWLAGEQAQEFPRSFAVKLRPSDTPVERKAALLLLHAMLLCWSLLTSNVDWHWTVACSSVAHVKDMRVHLWRVRINNQVYNCTSPRGSVKLVERTDPHPSACRNICIHWIIDIYIYKYIPGTGCQFAQWLAEAFTRNDLNSHCLISSH